MRTIKIGINGFGRIGRRLFRLLHEHPQIEVVAINDKANGATLAHLLKYDSIHGIFPPKISYQDAALYVDQQVVHLYQESDPGRIPWKNHDLDLIVEATGKFKTEEALLPHLEAGAQKVILSVPPADDHIKTIVLGVNDTLLDGSERIISNASCTTNNAAPMIKVVNDLCGIKQAYITTVHSYTTDQSLHDQPHADLRRARAAGQSIVPTTTGAAKALTKIFPDLSEVIGGCGIVARETTIEEINAAFEHAASHELKGILEFTNVPLVSIDIIGNTHSVIVDAQMTSVIGNLVKLIGWYDNETGYSSRLIDLILKIS